MAYHWWTRSVQDESRLPMGKAKAATKRELDLFLQKLDFILQTHGYYAFPEKEERMRRNLHNIFERNHLTNSELKTLYNVFSVLKKS